MASKGGKKDKRTRENKSEFEKSESEICGGSHGGKTSVDL